MFYGHGRGFRGACPPSPFTGRGRGSLPRCTYPGNWNYSNPLRGIRAAGTVFNSEQDINLLKEEAGMLRRNLAEIEDRITALESKGNQN